MLGDSSHLPNGRRVTGDKMKLMILWKGLEITLLLGKGKVVPVLN
jgi:hypothetical protein